MVDAREADIRVSGTALTFAQSMAVRVAITSFRITLCDAAMRKGIGETLADGYDARLAEVEALIAETAR